MKQGKKLFLATTTLALAVSSLTPSTLFAANVAEQAAVTEQAVLTEQSDVTLEQLMSNYQIVDEKLEGKIREVTYKKNDETHKVVFNGEDTTVKIDGKIQPDFSFEFDEEKARQNSIGAVSAQSGEVTTSAAPPMSGYQYVGTLSGSTGPAKDAAALAVALGGFIPGLGITARAVIVLTGYGINNRIPAAYYTYDLYQKGFMTTNWYQYSTIRMYYDYAHNQPMGQPWTTSPQHIDLPNS